MGFSSKLLLLLIVCVSFQAISAWPIFNIFRWKNLGYEVNKAADDAANDVRKDLLNVKNKIWKDTSKMIKKRDESTEALRCMMEVHQSVLSGMDRSSVEAINCIEKVRSKVGGIEEGNLSPGDLRSLKNEFKNEVKSCRNTSKNQLKNYQRELPSKMEQCLRQPNNPKEPAEDDAWYHN